MKKINFSNRNKWIGVIFRLLIVVILVCWIYSFISHEYLSTEYLIIPSKSSETISLLENRERELQDITSLPTEKVVYYDLIRVNRLEFSTAVWELTESGPVIRATTTISFSTSGLASIEGPMMIIGEKIAESINIQDVKVAIEKFIKDGDKNKLYWFSLELTWFSRLKVLILSLILSFAIIYPIDKLKGFIWHNKW